MQFNVEGSVGIRPTAVDVHFPLSCCILAIYLGSLSLPIYAVKLISKKHLLMYAML